MAPQNPNKISNFDLFQQMVIAKVTSMSTGTAALEAIGVARNIPPVVLDNRSNAELATLAVDFVNWRIGIGSEPTVLIQVGFQG